MDLPVFLINLDGSDDRLKEASAQLESAGVPFKRVPAFDGRALQPDEFPDYDRVGAMRYMGQPLRGGEIGCYLSHLDCARRFLETGSPACLVLEDDMKLQPDFIEAVGAILDWFSRSGTEWDVVNIGSKRNKIYTPMFDFHSGAQERHLIHAHYFPMTTTGLIWSRAGASQFLQDHRQIFAPVDIYMRHWQIRRNRGWSVQPPLVTTTGVDSEIGGRRLVGQRHRLYGLIKQRRLMQNKWIAWRNKQNRTRQA